MFRGGMKEKWKKREHSTTLYPIVVRWNRFDWMYESQCDVRGKVR